MRQTIRGLAFGLVGAGLLAASANAAEWRFNNPLPEKRPETKELVQWAEDIKKNSGGEINIKVYSGGSLGLKNPDVLRFLPTGAVDMSLAWANYLGRDAPALGTVFVQGSIGTQAELEKALPVVREIYSEVFAEWGIKATGFVALPMLEASIFCRDKPIRTLAELKGKKLRVWAKDQVTSFTRLGISAQIIPQEEMYVAMKTGVVDCAVYPAPLRPYRVASRGGQIRRLPLPDGVRTLRPRHGEQKMGWFVRQAQGGDYGCRQGHLGPHQSIR